MILNCKIKNNKILTKVIQNIIGNIETSNFLCVGNNHVIETFTSELNLQNIRLIDWENTVEIASLGDKCFDLTCIVDIMGCLDKQDLKQKLSMIDKKSKNVVIIANISNNDFLSSKVSATWDINELNKKYDILYDNDFYSRLKNSEGGLAICLRTNALE